ncbi:putative indole-3-pyruvate monooxygenase YUCCA10 [Raphanus sativus]|nr:putative indole-3-pyruvate monooxygenase YUCCA10 [Raphanus sativus]
MSPQQVEGRGEDTVTGETEVYWSEFVVVATGENGDPYILGVEGIDTFPGEIVHSSLYKSGRDFTGKNVFEVGGGNSGLEISYDLNKLYGNTAVLIRTPIKDNLQTRISISDENIFTFKVMSGLTDLNAQAHR